MFQPYTFETELWRALSFGGLCWTVQWSGIGMVLCHSSTGPFVYRKGIQPVQYCSNIGPFYSYTNTAAA